MSSRILNWTIIIGSLESESFWKDNERASYSPLAYSQQGFSQILSCSASSTPNFGLWLCHCPRTRHWQEPINIDKNAKLLTPVDGHTLKPNSLTPTLCRRASEAQKGWVRSSTSHSEFKASLLSSGGMSSELRKHQAQRELAELTFRGQGDFLVPWELPPRGLESWPIILGNASSLFHPTLHRYSRELGRCWRFALKEEKEW